MLRRMVAAALVILVPLLAEWSGVLHPFEDQQAAARMAMHRRAPTGNIVIVDIDAKSIAAMGSWPWRRTVFAQLIDKLVALKAGEIAIDVDFSAPSDPAGDAALTAALKNSGGSVILAGFAQKLSGASDAGSTYNQPLRQFGDNAWVASVNVRPDRDGQVRSFSYGLVVDGSVVPSMPAVLAGGLGEAGKAFQIDFSINPGAIDRVSLIDVLHGTVDPNRIAGKKVIVGAQAVELRDFFQVPVAGTISGALLQALATETLMQGRALHRTNVLVTLAGLILVAFAAFLIGRAKWQYLCGGLFVAAVAVEASAALLQTGSTLVVTTAPWLLSLAILGIIALLSEIDIRQLLQSMWRARASNAETLLTKVVADSFAGVVVVDEAGTIRAASRSASELLGRRNDLVGAKASAMLPPQLLAAVDAVLGVAGFDRCVRRPSVFPLRRDDGQTRMIEYVATVSEVESASADPRDAKIVHRVASLTFNDITEQKAAEAKITHMAHFDSLTQLPNRNQLIERLESVFTASDTRLRSSAVVCFDLDRFKVINDTLGHHIGDLVLRGVAARATDLLPNDAVVARLGGDEYAALFSGAQAADDAVAFATHIVAASNKPLDADGRQVLVGTSAGVALADARDKGPDDILRRADMALYRAKSGGGSGFVVFDRAMLHSFMEQQRLELELKRALEKGEFEVWYQPQVELSTNRMVGVEALVRWRHPKRGLVPPDEFIPAAESMGLIDDLGRLVLESACTEVAGWAQPIRLAVNASSAQFARGDIAEFVSQTLKRTGFPASRLDLEITESLFIQPSATVHGALGALRAMGVGIALDDFGTGYSSLSYIQNFPITKIKLDKSFVADLPENTGSAAIVRAVTRLTKDLGLLLVAEGVENAAQLALLKSVGVDQVQGFLFGRPQPGREIAHELKIADDDERLRA